MDEAKAKQILDQVVGQVFGYQNPLTVGQAMSKFAFDVRLPQQVFDSSTGDATWAASLNENRYLTFDSVKKRIVKNDGLQDYRKMNDVESVLSAWSDINYAMSEREIDSTNVFESDGVYHSENVYRSLDIRKSKNILFSDGVDSSEFIVAGQTSKSSKYCIRIEDSKNVSNSFNVNWSNKITSSYFIRDCYDLVDCMFCTHLAGKRFCIANIQLEEAEYNEMKLKIIQWILT